MPTTVLLSELYLSPVNHRITFKLACLTQKVLATNQAACMYINIAQLCIAKSVKNNNHPIYILQIHSEEWMQMNVPSTKCAEHWSDHTELPSVKRFSVRHRIHTPVLRNSEGTQLPPVVPSSMHSVVASGSSCPLHVHWLPNFCTQVDTIIAHQSRYGTKITNSMQCREQGTVPAVQSSANSHAVPDLCDFKKHISNFKALTDTKNWNLLKIS